MKNKIIFTQDVPGEREWINSQFPGYTNLESEFGPFWAASPPTDQANSLLWEIPPDSNFDLSTLTNCDFIKSLYRPTDSFVSQAWTEAQSLLIRNPNFSGSEKSDRAQVLTFTRCGTVFAESILYEKCNYTPAPETPFYYNDIPAYHYFMDGAKTEFYSIIANTRPDVFLTYRKDWWGWATSLLICKQYDYYHYDDQVDWSSLTPFVITESHFDHLLTTANYNWKSLCHFRTRFPFLNFYIIEYSDIIKHKKLTNHDKIKYDKRSLISNYDIAEQLFKTKYLNAFIVGEQRCLQHLVEMKCNVIKDFDQFVVN